MIYAILLLGLALALVLAEVLLPSGGLLGIGAAVSAAGCLGLAFTESYSMGMTFLLVISVAAPVVGFVGLKLFPSTPMGRRMINAGLSFEATAATDLRDLELVGQTGEVLTPLRPAGHARLGGRRVDVVSRGEVIEPGEQVRVLEVQGNRVVVIRAGAASLDSPSTTA